MAERLEGKQRDLSLDLIRGVAGFLVVSVHFFLNCGFYSAPVLGKRMLAMVTARMGFMTCVPLFLLLTGYLCRDRSLSARHYRGLGRILATYVLCGLVCLGLRLWRGNEVSVWKSLLDYTAAPYGWYIKMYIGLFLLIPFVNLVWKGLESRRARLALVATLLVLTTLPSLTNLEVKVLPDWWTDLWPLTYYALGAYFGAYQPKLRPGWGTAALAAAVLAGGALGYCRSAGGAFLSAGVCDWFGPTVVLSSCLLFLLLRRVPVDRAPGWLRWLIGKSAELSLGIYLVSWCFDSAAYPALAARVPEVPHRLLWYFAVVPAVYLCSALAAQVIEWVRKGLGRCGAWAVAAVRK